MSAPLAMLQDSSCPTCCRGGLEQHLWVGASPSASCEPPSHLTPSCSTAFASDPRLALPCPKEGSARAQDRELLHAASSEGTQQAGHGRSLAWPLKSICSLMEKSRE